MMGMWGCSSAGEHRVRNAGVEGSNPFISTKEIKDVGHQAGWPFALSGECCHFLVYICSRNSCRNGIAVSLTV